MKYKILIGMLILVSNVFGQNKVLDWGIEEIDSVVVETVDWDIFTPININCEDFSTKFSDIKVYTIKDSLLIFPIINSIKNLLKNNIDIIDTRCKIYLYNKKKIKTICCSSNVVKVDDQLYYTSEELIDIINELSLSNLLYTNNIKKENYPTFPGGMDSLYHCINIYSQQFYNFHVFDTLKLLIDFNIDYKGNAMDIKIINRNTRTFENSDISKVIHHIFEKKLKWSSSDKRREKIRMVYPLTLYPQ